VRTAYEYLGLRFDRKTRLLAAVLFLVLRGLSVGFVIYTPSLVLAKVFHMPLAPMILVMGGVAVAYTSAGGLRAVISTDVKQMAVMVLGLLVAFFAILARLPEGIGLGEALHLAREAGRTTVVDWSWNPSEKYTIWSSLIGGLFLFLSYFGTDQSQVQRLLAGRSIAATRGALLLNSLAKLPFQFLVLLCGVLLFVFYLFQSPPLSFEPAPAGGAITSSAAYRSLEREFGEVREDLGEAARVLAADGGEEASLAYTKLLDRSETIRGEARDLRGGSGDTNYVFLEFILHNLPAGIVGLLLAAIFAAALSSVDSELNSMATVAVLDVYLLARRRPPEDRAVLRTARFATVGVGALATLFALYAGEIGSLIEAVNRVGSYVYGSLLGAFVLAVAVRRATGNGAFTGLLAGMAVVAAAAQTGLAFLYLNTVGVVTVVGVGTLVSLMDRRRSGSP